MQNHARKACSNDKAFIPPNTHLPFALHSQVNFNILGFDNSPLSPEMYVASEPNSSFQTIYNIDGAETEFLYIAGRTGQFLVQCSGFILKVIEALGEGAAEGA